MNKLSALVLLAPLVNAITFSVPSNLTSGGQATITWTTAAGDPSVWSLELVNTVFHNSFALANNVQNAAGSISLELPVVPVGDGYTLEAVNISDINTVFSTSPGFSIGATVSTSASSSSTSSSSASTSGSSSGSFTSSGSSSSSTPGSSSVSGSSISGSSGSNQASGSSSSPSASPTNFNNGGSSGAISNTISSWFAVAVAAVAGGVFAF